VDLTLVLDALASLLAAGGLGFLAYGGWLCLCRLGTPDDAEELSRGAPGAQSLPRRSRHTHRPVALD